MILILDNRDSFVFNIARYFEEIGERVLVQDSFTASIEQIEKSNPTALVISPGPCTPEKAGISLEAIGQFSNKIPILGVCLGHQAIAHAFGANVSYAAVPRHGHSIKIRHKGEHLFSDLPNPLAVGLYHSLSVQSLEGTPIIADAWSDDGDIMALRHETLPLYGVQFHPESVLSEQGHALFRNFIDITQDCFA